MNDKNIEPEVIDFSESESESLSDMIEKEQGAAGESAAGQSVGEAVAGVTAMMCAAMSAKTKAKEFELTEPEYNELKESVNHCADEYLDSSDLPAWAGLSLVILAIGGQRYMIYQALLLKNQAEQAANKRPDDE